MERVLDPTGKLARLAPRSITPGRRQAYIEPRRMGACAGPGARAGDRRSAFRYRTTVSGMVGFV
jgi:hypothetical protein